MVPERDTEEGNRNAGPALNKDGWKHAQALHRKADEVQATPRTLAVEAATPGKAELLPFQMSRAVPTRCLPHLPAA